jgi:4-amino-4-deoxy-L-arabinose transferase-like glycosyltransferase
MKKNSYTADTLIITIVIGGFFALFLGLRALGVPDEGRYAEIPREMLQSFDFITPSLNGVPYFEKPPLFYWLQTLSITLFGLKEWSLRLMTMLIGLSGCLLTYLAARKVYNRRTGLLATSILATCILYYAMSRYITLDMLVSVCISASLFCFMLAIPHLDDQTNKTRRRYLYGMYTFSALAVMSKGLIGLALPGVIIFIWFCITSQWRLLKNCALPSGILLFLIITLPWHILAQLQYPDFFDFYIIKQQVLRFSTDQAGREQAWWLLPAGLRLGLLPWTTFCLQSIVVHLQNLRHGIKNQPQTLLLLIWNGTIYSFFTFSHSLLIPYLLPIFPAAAIVIAHHFDASWDKKQPWPLRIGYCCLVVIFCMVGIVGYLYASKGGYLVDKMSNLHIAIGISFSLLGSIGGCALYWRGRIKAALACLIIFQALFLSNLNILYPYLDTRSIKPLALKLQPLLKANDEVACYHHYYQDLPVYLQRQVSIAGWKNELTYGIQHTPSSKQWIYSTQTLWQHWQQHKRMYMIMPLYYYRNLQHRRKDLFEVAKTPDHILLSNQPIQGNRLEHQP